MTSDPRPDERGRPYWIGLVAGIAIMLFGVVGALVNFGATHPVQFAAWLVGSDLAHDLLVAPIACGVGWLLTATVPRPLRAPARAALLTTAVLVGVAWAPLHGYGRLPDNPSLEPLDYGTGVLTAVGAVWIACAVWAVVAAVGAHRRRKVVAQP